MLQSVTECYRVLQSVTECYRVLQSVAECYRVYRVLQSVTECYRVFLAHLLGPISGLVTNTILFSIPISLDIHFLHFILLTFFAQLGDT